MFYTRIMNNQFKINQYNRFVIDSNDVKFVYIEIFLKKKIISHMLWKTKIISKLNKKRIWIDFKKYLKINVRKISTKMKNIYDKYLNYKQPIKQLIMNYDVHRIVLITQFISNLKFNNKKEFQNFIRKLLSKHKRFLFKKRDMHIKMKILNRFKKIENVDYQNNQYNKQKYIENNNSDDSNKRKKNDENFVNEKKTIQKNKTKQTKTTTKKMIRNSKSIILIENQWNFDCIVELKSNT